MGIIVDEVALVERHTPLMVLYPEIPPGSLRRVSESYPHESPLAYDYHPRDIRLVLANVGFYSRFRPWKDKPQDWDGMLGRMERARYERDLDVAPHLKLDDREGFWDAYAAIPKNRDEFQRCCYARVVTGKGIHHDRVLVQYWYPYFYNDFWNTHEMDWEVIMMVVRVVDGDARPVACAYSAHGGGHWLKWADVEKADDSEQLCPRGTHPIAYVANGSHANYFYGSSLYVTAPPIVRMAAKLRKKPRSLIDYTTSLEEGEGYLVSPKLIPDAEGGVWTGEWRWLNQKSLWGSPGKFFDLEFGDSGPQGPPQGGDRWDFPFRWIDTACALAPSRMECRAPTLLSSDDIPA